MSYTEIKKSALYESAKRLMDIILSALLLILFFPVIILVGFAIRVNSEGPIFADTPQRVGKNGKLFKMYKFRSMIQNAHEILRINPKFAQLYEAYKKGSYKLRNDPRITPVGRFIRKY